jgi:hypothetical protein
LRQANGRSHTGHTLEGRSRFFRIFGMSADLNKFSSDYSATASFVGRISHISICSMSA